MDSIDVTYRFPPGSDPDREARVIAIGQTAGTWGAQWEKHSARLRSHLAEVGEVTRKEDGSSLAVVRFPLSNCPEGIGSLLTMIYGKYSLSGPAKIVDLHLPEGWGIEPRFGVTGIRKVTGVQDRPLFMGIFKPSLGLTPEEHACILREAGMAGLDIIKDDEILPNLPDCPTLERLRACRPVLDEVQKFRAGRESRESAMLYAVNLSGRSDSLQELARKLVAEGANALLLNVLSYGFPILEALASDPLVGVPLFVHPAFSGAWSGSEDWGLSHSVVLGRLASAAGADAVLIPTHYGSLPFSAQEEKNIREILLSRDVFPVPSAGIHPGLLPRVMTDYGEDVILNAGTGIMDHPQGIAAGVRAFHEALDRFRRGLPFEEADLPEGPLKSAVGKWGH
ncbi:MAG: RuBisCO large subunit C-terminal-like domain-containing protein [Leptospirales bacterium]